jgi:hypothetical protein
VPEMLRLPGQMSILNTRVLTRLEPQPDENNACIIRRHKLRHLIIRQQSDTLASSPQKQVVYFPARHSRCKKAKGIYNIDFDKLLQLQDNSTIKSSSLLVYTKDMPAAILSNIGIVNGAQGKVIGFVPDPKG